jgi:hypothetical protein
MYLARIQERQSSDLWSHSLDIDTLAHNGGIIATKLKSDSLQCLACALHNFLPRRRAAREGDLVNSRVGSQPRTEIVITGKSLDDSRWEELLCQLGQLEVAVGCERGGFEDDCIPSEDCGADFSACYKR